MHIEYAEYKYRNFPIFIHTEHKTIIYMEAFALVLYTWAENTAIYLLALLNKEFCISVLGYLWRLDIYEKCIQILLERDMILFT